METNMKKTLLFTLFILLILTGCQKEIQHPCNETHLKERPTVSYLGPEGTYTEEATLLYFEDEATLLPLKTVDLAIEALKNGESDYAVIPQENTLGV